MDGRRGFSGLRVLSLESRHAGEMSKLIANFGGLPVLAPSMREVPLRSNREALRFAEELLAGRIDAVIFLTGVGTRALSRVVETTYPRERFRAALSRVAVVARGPKSLAALRELGVPIALSVPEPNTWRQVLEALDQRADSLPLRGRTVAVQEYGVSNPELLDGLAQRGARVLAVPVYGWQLPADLGPLREAVRAIITGAIDVMLFTSSVQVRHLMEVARQMNLEDAVQRAGERIVVASIGPLTSEELRAHGWRVSLEPKVSKMGFLVRESADHCAALMATG